MSITASEPTPSVLPVRPLSRPTSPSRSNQATTRPHPTPAFPTIKLRLKVTDLNHPAATVFFDNCNASIILASAVDTVLTTLYKPTPTNSHIPPTRSVTLVLRSMPGVAYTTGSALDDDHKEIHFSLDYIKDHIPADPPNRQHDEIKGVLVHEMVHCWQWNALGTAPGGLIEGIADFVRLKAGLSPPHWKKEQGGDWDAGYQHTAYFLQWLEDCCGEGTVRKINGRLKEEKYDEEEFWNRLFGENVGELWEEYSETLSGNIEGEKTAENTIMKKTTNEDDPDAELVVVMHSKAQQALENGMIE